MATSQIASMLDELMGRNRNFAPDDAKARELKWTDPDICKYYIVQFCPHDLFTNTKADLGTCGKIHDDALKVSKLRLQIHLTQFRIGWGSAGLTIFLRFTIGIKYYY